MPFRRRIQTGVMTPTSYYIDDKNELYTLPEYEKPVKISAPSSIIDDDLAIVNDLAELKSMEPAFGEILDKGSIGSLIGVRIKDKGYLICGVKNKQRLWQEDECGILYYLASQL